jgi:hypothetical protein
MDCPSTGSASEAAEKPLRAVLLSPLAVILSAAKNLALSAQGKLREGSRSELFHNNVRFFLRRAQDRQRLIRMTVPKRFSAACSGPSGAVRTIPKSPPAVNSGPPRSIIMIPRCIQRYISTGDLEEVQCH